MNKYSFNNPMRFTEETIVYNEQGNPRFQMQGFYKGITGYLLKLINFQINIKGVCCDGVQMYLEQEPILKEGITGKWRLITSKSGHAQNECIIHNKTKIKTDIMMNYYRGDTVIEMSSTLIDRGIYFRERNTNKLLAKAEVPRVYIKDLKYEVYDTSIKEWEVALLYYLYIIWR
ncbi:tubby C-terminal domain-like protein [Alteribacter aurantiacus]|uniref:tubby C-terminal domain-like protein n=1 Tax=Alteribacter aurantiacus TaxID=254410 RepID=UPI000478FEE4|nr:hypothetical protein [Alteribacter aurantiacus]